jgi:hypothetical protein
MKSICSMRYVNTNYNYTALIIYYHNLETIDYLLAFIVGKIWVDIFKWILMLFEFRIWGPYLDIVFMFFFFYPLNKLFISFFFFVSFAHHSRDGRLKHTINYISHSKRGKNYDTLVLKNDTISICIFFPLPRYLWTCSGIMHFANDFFSFSMQ